MWEDNFYQLLMQQKNELRDRINNIRNDLKNHHASKQLSQKAMESANDDVLLVLENEAQLKLDMTMEAIRRLKDGEFGYCLECGHQINSERLTSLPHTRFCRVCAREKQHRSSSTTSNTSIKDEVDI